MNTVVDDFDDLGQARKEREIHLSTGTVLGIFFGLALICALFFGFGYTAGRRSTIASTDATEAGSPGFTNFKPAPGAVAIQPVAGYLSAKQAAEANATANNAQHYYGAAPSSDSSQKQAATAVYTPTPVAATAPKPNQTAKSTDAEIAPAPPTRQVAYTVPAPAAPQPVALPAAAPAGGPSMVQVAAVSHQEDAEVLLSALKRHGYAVFTASAPTDRLIHVQLGPFANRREADAMRQRLLSDGYNAIVK